MLIAGRWRLIGGLSDRHLSLSGLSGVEKMRDMDFGPVLDNIYYCSCPLYCSL